MSHVSVSTPRRDKKKEIKATLPRITRDVLEQRARTVGLSPMSYAERLAMLALDDEKVIRAMSPFFKRGYCRGGHAWIGRVITPSLEAMLPDGDDATRFPVKFLPDDHLQVGELAYALSTSLSQALTVLLAESLLQGVIVPSVETEVAR